MKFLPAEPIDDTLVGMAYGPTARRALAARPGLIDYVEIPFEQLRHDPASGTIQHQVPAILHCASMSLAGFVPPTEETLAAIAREAARTRTPWIGEHLAFLSAEALEDDGDAEPTVLSYTVCPQLSADTLARTATNLDALRARFSTPLIVENSPQYFAVPGSEMSMVDFLIEVAEGCEVGLLLDLSHFLITAINMRFDPRAELRRLPLERVVEVHLSGYSMQAGKAWDDHSNPAPELEFDLLAAVLDRTRPRAVTFEYNWGEDFPDSLIADHLLRVRRMLA